MEAQQLAFPLGSPTAPEAAVTTETTVIPEVAVTAEVTATPQTAATPELVATPEVTEILEDAEPATGHEPLGHPVNKKKFAKLLAQLMDSLVDFPSAEEKLAALCSRYTEMSVQARAARQLVAAAAREREALRADNHRLALVKGKLETLCRELQRNNKHLLDESLERVHTEEKKRREMTEHFQATLDNIRQQMELNEARSDRLRAENQELAQRLSSLLQDYAQREEQVAKILKYRELQQQLSSVKLQEEEEQRRDGEQRHERDKEFLLHQAAESKMVLKVMQEKEEALKRQLLLYTQRISEFQEMLTKSNKSFSTFRGEMDQMTKKIMKLEKEALVWKERWQQSSRVLLGMTEEKVVRDKEMECLQLKLQRLERLCRALQTERSDLASCVDKLTSQIHGVGDALDDAPDPGASLSASGEPAYGLAGLVPLYLTDAGACDVTDPAVSSELAGSKSPVGAGVGSPAGETTASLARGPGEPRPRGAVGDPCPPAPVLAGELPQNGGNLNGNATVQLSTAPHFANADLAETRFDLTVGGLDPDTGGINPVKEVGRIELDVAGNFTAQGEGVDSKAANVAAVVGETEGNLPVKRPALAVSAVSAVNKGSAVSAVSALGTVSANTFDRLQVTCHKLEESVLLMNAMCEQSQGFLNAHKPKPCVAVEGVANGSRSGTPPCPDIRKEMLASSPREGDLILSSDQLATPTPGGGSNVSEARAAVNTADSADADWLNAP